MCLLGASLDLSSRYSFSGGARDRPVSAHFHGSLSLSIVLEVFEQNKKIERTDRNYLYKLVHGHGEDTWTQVYSFTFTFRHHCHLSLNAILVLFPVIVMQSENKEPSWGGWHTPLMRGTVPLLRVPSLPHERVSRTTNLLPWSIML